MQKLQHLISLCLVRRIVI